VKLFLLQRMHCKKKVSCGTRSENGNFVKIYKIGVNDKGGGREAKIFFFSKSLFDFQINFHFDF
jgi:hypothetical protein